MSDRESEILLESAVAAHRERDLEGRLVPPPAWWDLAPEALDELFRRQVMAREVERALHPSGQSATARAVLARIWW